MAIVLSLAGCVNVPENVIPVDIFNIERYLGTWYEIAGLIIPLNGAHVG